MKLEDRQSVAKEFKIQENVFKGYLKTISIFRNICAHDERLYNTKLKNEIISSEIHLRLEIPKDKGGKHTQGIKDVFCLLICIKELLFDDQDEFNSIILEINEEMDKLQKQLHTIDIKQVLNSIGFPFNWKEL